MKTEENMTIVKALLLGFFTMKLTEEEEGVVWKMETGSDLRGALA